jgi:hypothetical protein
MSKVDNKVNLANRLEAEAAANGTETGHGVNPEKMNIYEKIQLAKMSLNEANIKKSGFNKFSNFAYYELADFMPVIIKIFNDLKLFSKITFTNESAMLKIINAENPAEQEEYTSPMKDLEIKGANALQALGGAETYQRRYLYMSALDITENDMFDASSGSGSGDNNKNDAKTEQPPMPQDIPAEPAQPQTGTKRASDKQLKMIHGIIDDIAKGYGAVGQQALPEAILKRMRETLKIDKDLNDFLVADASKAIDYLTDIKVKIPKPQSA